MKVMGFKRYRFTGMLYLPKEDPTSSNNTVLMTYEKDVNFDFSDDPDAPRQVFTASEPYPQSSEITNITDKYGDKPYPEGIFKITSVEPVVGPFGKVEMFRMQAALTEFPDFGYDGIIRAV